jgi:hypothetical protein
MKKEMKKVHLDEIISQSNVRSKKVYPTVCTTILYHERSDGLNYFDSGLFVSLRPAASCSVAIACSRTPYEHLLCAKQSDPTPF